MDGRGIITFGTAQKALELSLLLTDHILKVIGLWI